MKTENLPLRVVQDDVYESCEKKVISNNGLFYVYLKLLDLPGFDTENKVAM